ncbi:hypothetical protein [Treponema pedis]|uniref:hypothetical protein n=1 Tax=Treponema pedis TaxID=409322 RepID=UPI00040DB740|nr:hypothetical protein [Treponema pedis]
MKIIKNRKCFFSIFSFVSLLFLFIFIIVNFYSLKIEYAEKKLLNGNFEIYNTGCIVKALGQNTENVSAAVSFYLPDGKPLGTYERSWHGWELKLECIVLQLKKGALVFPYRIFSDESKYGTGIKLFSYYLKNGYPAIYDYSFFSDEEKDAVKTLFSFAAFSPNLFLTFSSAKKQTVSLRRFNPDTEYILTVSSSGSLLLKTN